jgi:hypothetical protein
VNAPFKITKNANMKTNVKSKKPQWPGHTLAHQSTPIGLSHDLLPHLDKPRIRRAVGSASAAGGLLLAQSPVNAQSSIPGFVLRSIDSPHNVALPDVVWGCGAAFHAPYLLDVDSDGDLDLVHGSKLRSGINAKWNENVGTAASPLFVANKSREDLVAPLPAGISWADFDGDGDEDKITFGEGAPSFFENTGTTEEPNLER